MRRRRSRSTTPPVPRGSRRGCSTIPRRQPECTKRGNRCRDEPRVGVPLDPANVSLQRLVLPVAVTVVAARHVALRAVDPDAVWQLIDSEGVTHIQRRPHGSADDHQSSRGAPPEQPKPAMVAASPPSPTLLARMAESNFRIVHVYGLTETYGPITVSSGSRGVGALCRSSSARRCSRVRAQAYPSADLVRVVDEDNARHPAGRRSDGRGGHARQQRDERLFRGRSGHRKSLSRRLVSFRRPGRHGTRMATSSCAIEARTSSSPAARTSRASRSSRPFVPIRAFFSVRSSEFPHERWEERPKAYVTLNTGASAGAEEIIAFCRQRLAHFKCPDAIEFGPLPKTSTGKVQKFALRERESADARPEPARRSPRPTTVARIDRLDVWSSCP